VSVVVAFDDRRWRSTIGHFGSESAYRVAGPHSVQNGGEVGIVICQRHPFPLLAIWLPKYVPPLFSM